MQLLEYQAKTLLADAGVKVPPGELIDDSYRFTEEVMLKAQIPAGNRGKHGGIVRATDANTLRVMVDQLKSLEIDGYRPKSILAEKVLKFDREHYFSLLVDRNAGKIQLLARARGGMDVEGMKDAVLSKTLTPKNVDQLAETLRKFYGYGDALRAEFLQFLHNTFSCFVAIDALLLEINPLVVIDNSLFALDCKLEVDDNALFRHHELEGSQPSANFVMLDKNGDTAVVANGAGLAMATVDEANLAGLAATNFLDIGGGADSMTITNQFDRFADLPNLKAVIVNVFAGITRCDQIATAIVAAQNELAALPPLFVRLHGTNYNEAKSILDKAGIRLFQSLHDCIEAAGNV